MKRIRVAIIGQGRSGRNIHGVYLSGDQARYQIVAAVDPLEERRARAQAEYACDVYPEHAPLLKRRDIDLIINATPTHLHVPVTKQCLKAGFNVLCEKPLAARAKDVDALIAAAKKAGKTLAIFQQSRFAPYFEQVRKVIDSNVIGDPVQITIAFNGFSRRYDWQTLTEMLGGNLLNTGPHPLDQALQLFGPDAMPKVFCAMRNANSYGDAEDHVNLILTGDGHPIVQVEISSACAYPGATYHVYATRGGLRGTMTELEWKYYKPKEAPKLKLDRTPLKGADGSPVYCSDNLLWHTESWKVPEEKKDMFRYMSDKFYGMLHDTLAKGKPLAITPEQVRRQIAVIEECHRQNPHIYRKKH